MAFTLSKDSNTKSVSSQKQIKISPEDKSRSHVINKNNGLLGIVIMTPFFILFIIFETGIMVTMFLLRNFIHVVLIPVYLVKLTIILFQIWLVLLVIAFLIVLIPV